MKVQLTTDRCGLSWEEHEGDIVDMSHDEARRLIAANQAIAVEDNNNPELAPLDLLDGAALSHKQNHRNRRR